jgi:hypothetical protein
MPKCPADELDFGHLGRRVIDATRGWRAQFGRGLMLLRQVDRRIGLSAAAADALHDPRVPLCGRLLEHRAAARLEFGAQGPNPRFVVTNLDSPADILYDGLYCQRGEAENRIKETELDLFGTRASSHKSYANWLRCLFSAPAYTLMQSLKTMALAGTELARASSATSRVRLMKIGAAVIRHPAHPYPVRLAPSAARGLPRCRPRIGFSMTPFECVPDMLTLRGLGVVCPRTANLPVY